MKIAASAAVVSFLLFTGGGTIADALVGEMPTLSLTCGGGSGSVCPNPLPARTVSTPYTGDAAEKELNDAQRPNTLLRWGVWLVGIIGFVVSGGFLLWRNRS